MEFNRITGGKKDHYLLVLVLLKEGEEQSESIFRAAKNESLVKGADCLHGLFESYEDGVLHGQPHEILHLFCLRGREENSLSLLWNQLEDLVDLLLESLLENLVCFIDDQHTEIADVQSVCVEKMVQQSPRSCHDNIGSFGQLNRLCFLIGASNYQTGGSAIEFSQKLEDIKYLLGQFSDRGDDDYSSSLFLGELLPV